MKDYNVKNDSFKLEMLIDNILYEQNDLNLSNHNYNSNDNKNFVQNDIKNNIINKFKNKVLFFLFLIINFSLKNKIIIIKF